MLKRMSLIPQAHRWASLLGMVVWGYGSRELGATQTLGLFGFIPLLPWVWRDGRHSLAWLVPLYLGYMGTLFAFRDRALEPGFMPHGVLPSVLVLVTIRYGVKAKPSTARLGAGTRRRRTNRAKASVPASAATVVDRLVSTGPPHTRSPVTSSCRGKPGRREGRYSPCAQK